MTELAESIAKYIDHMKDSGLNVSIHFSNEMLTKLPSHLFEVLFHYNVHTNPYCTWVKKCDNHRCIESQQELIKNGRIITRICHAGVKEYVTPFYRNGEPSGIVSISGYRDADIGVVNKKLWLSSLSDEEIPIEKAKTLVTPLIMMLERLIEREPDQGDGEYNLIVQYLSEYYITADLDSICRHFHRSASHISHLFKKNSGMTIRAYCNKLKLEKAKQLLSNTSLPVTNVAVETGFHDASYFINLFRKKYGISPLAYRKNIDKNQQVE